jgi:serine protease Do
MCIADANKVGTNRQNYGEKFRALRQNGNNSQPESRIERYISNAISAEANRSKFHALRSAHYRKIGEASRRESGTMISAKTRTIAASAIGLPLTFVMGGMAFSHLRGDTQQKPTPVNPPAQALSLQSAFEQVADVLRPSVVHITSVKTTTRPTGQDSPFEEFSFPGMPEGFGNRQFRMAPRRMQASGSGVIVRGDGYILTNDHVVQGADKVTVRLNDGREFTGKVKRDFRSDLALVKIEATGLPAAQLADDSEKVKIGQWAIAFGSPFGLSDTMTTGIVSSLHRNQAIGAGTNRREYSSLIQTDASINPGNSGGPLVDIYGRVIGINVAIESPSGGNVGIGFAIPANTARFVMEQLTTKGSVTRGYLGVRLSALDYEARQKYNAKSGALVQMVSDDSPAAKAGLEVGDVIVRFNGQPVTSDGSLRDRAAQTVPGTRVPIVVVRDGKEQTLNLTVGTMEDAETPKPIQRTAGEQSGNQGKLGVAIADADNAENWEQLGIKGTPRKGALVAEVTPGSPAAQAGIQPGDVFVQLNGKTIDSAKTLTEVARGLKEGASVEGRVRRGNQTVLVQIELN